MPCKKSKVGVLVKGGTVLCGEKTSPVNAFGRKDCIRGFHLDGLLELGS